MPVMDIQAIRQILPHRYPMLLVDRIEELESDRIVGIKNVTINEPFFNGHFPDYPVMPGVLIVEAMAQVAGVLVLSQIEDRNNKVVLLAGVDGAKFQRGRRGGSRGGNVVCARRSHLKLTCSRKRCRFTPLRLSTPRRESPSQPAWVRMR
jgi:beta-hydroxyacyl-ACP dehydratase FabZ